MSNRNKYETTADRLMNLSPVGLKKLAEEIRKRGAAGKMVSDVLIEALQGPKQKLLHGVLPDEVGGTD